MKIVPTNRHFSCALFCLKNAGEVHVLLFLTSAGLPYLMMTCLYDRPDTKYIRRSGSDENAEGVQQLTWDMYMLVVGLDLRKTKELL